MITGHGPALYPPDRSSRRCHLMMTHYIIGGLDYGQLERKRKPRLALLLGDYASGRSPEMAKWYCEQKGIEIVGTGICFLYSRQIQAILLIRTRIKT